MSSIEAAERLDKRMQAYASVAHLDAASAEAQAKLAHEALDLVLEALAAEVAAGKKVGMDGAKVDTAETAVAVVNSGNDNLRREIPNA